MASVLFSNLSEKIKPLLSDDELHDLLIKARESSDSSKNAIEEIIYSNLGLIFKIVKRFNSYVTPTFDLNDLQSEAIIGFIKAIYRFDITKGYKFSTYAMTSMTFQIYRAHEKTATPLRIAGNVQRIQYKILKELKNYDLEDSNSEHQITYLIRKTGHSRKKIEEILTLPKVVFSLDDETNYESKSTYAEFIGDGKNDFMQVEVEFDRIRLLKFLKEELDSNEFKVFYYHYGFNGLDNKQNKYNATSKLLGMPVLQVKKFHISGLKKLNKPENRKTLSMLLTGNGRYR